MELKVWVDGVQRVVCGLSEDTSCQDVVIALAQAIGQTGRYVLVEKLRDKERQLVATERPLQALAKLGQLSSEVQFILRRTGPTSSEESGLDRAPFFPRLVDPEPPKKKELRKPHSFNLGPSTSSNPYLKQSKQVLRDSSEQRPPSDSPGPFAQAGPSKEEVFRHILQQQSRMQALQANLSSLDQQVWVLEQPEPPVFTSDLLEDIEYLGETLRRNEAELAHGEYWESEYQNEVQKEQDMLRHLKDINHSLDKHSQMIHDTEIKRERLEQDIQLQIENKKNVLHQARVTVEESLRQTRTQLETAQHQGSELGSLLEETEKAFRVSKDQLEVKGKELEELNKELRQCNLQQFIQQAGGPSPQVSVQSDDQDLAYLMPDGASDEDSNCSVLEFNTHTTAKQIQGRSRSLQNPLVSGLHLEGLQSREVSWR